METARAMHAQTPGRMETTLTMKPSLWRTARAIANADRLRLVRIVSDGGGAMSVSQVAGAAGLPLPTASLYLRALNARGILGVERHDGRVFYTLSPDRSLPVAASVQAAFKAIFRRGGPPDGWEERLVPGIRAFSHFRRLAMMEALMRSPGLTPEEWSERVRIPPIAFTHHFAVLLRSGLLRRDDRDRCSLVRPRDPVLAALFATIDAGSAKPSGEELDPG